MEARLTWDQETAGSNPAHSTKRGDVRMKYILFWLDFTVNEIRTLPFGTHAFTPMHESDKRNVSLPWYTSGFE